MIYVIDQFWLEEVTSLSFFAIACFLGSSMIILAISSQEFDLVGKVDYWVYLAFSTVSFSIGQISGNMTVTQSWDDVSQQC